MNKRRFLKLFFRIVIAALLVSSLLVAGYIWYETFDISGLTLYNGEPITDMLLFEDRVYFITEDAGYVAGGYDSNDRRYRNSEFHRNEELGIPSPVRFFEGKIKLILPYSYKSALFITESNELFVIEDFNVRMIGDNATYAARSAFGGEIYIVDTSGRLLVKYQNEEERFLCDGVKQVEAYRDRVFALFNDGNICELIVSTTDGCIVSSPTFSNAQKFSVLDTSYRYDDKLILDDAEAQSTPLFNILTKDGQLYAKGAYNLLHCTISGSSFPSPYIIDEFTVIAENVSDFSLAYMGTAILHKNGDLSYYGFETHAAQKTTPKFGHVKLTITGDAVRVGTTRNACIYVKCDNGDYAVWGKKACIIFDKASDEHNVMNGYPVIISTR